MKLMFLARRGRPDILPGISYLLTRVSKPNGVDWNILKKILNFLKKTKEEKLILKADDTQTINWYIDAAFGAHDDMKSYTGACMTLGKGMICTFSNKQKVNSRSLTEAELIAVDDKVLKVMWTNNLSNTNVSMWTWMWFTKIIWFLWDQRQMEWKVLVNKHVISISSYST